MSQRCVEDALPQISAIRNRRPTETPAGGSVGRAGRQEQRPEDGEQGSGEVSRALAVYAGSFDQPRWGHLDLIERAAALFDNVIFVSASLVREIASHGGDVSGYATEGGLRSAREEVREEDVASARRRRAAACVE